MPMTHSNEVTNHVSQPCLTDSNGKVMTPEKKLLELFKGLHVCKLCEHVLLNDKRVFHTMGRRSHAATLNKSVSETDS